MRSMPTHVEFGYHIIPIVNLIGEDFKIKNGNNESAEQHKYSN